MLTKNTNTFNAKPSTANSVKLINALSLAPALHSTCIDSCDPVLQINILYEKITHLFITIGIPPHVNGYHFLREAIMLTIGNFEMLKCVTKKLYPMVASNFNTSTYIVEKSIRNAIEIACNKGKMVNLNEIFGIVIFESNYKPSNSELIALLAEKLYIECR